LRPATFPKAPTVEAREKYDSVAASRHYKDIRTNKLIATMLIQSAGLKSKELSISPHVLANIFGKEKTGTKKRWGQ